jgi:hypothetical protein
LLVPTIVPKVPSRKKAAGMQQPRALPTLRCRPDRVSGMPIDREIFDLNAEIPTARFHENDRPGIPNLRAIDLMSITKKIYFYIVVSVIIDRIYSCEIV